MKILPEPGDRVRITGILPQDHEPPGIGVEGTVTAPAVKIGNRLRFSVAWDDGRESDVLDVDPFIVVPETRTPSHARRRITCDQAG